MKVKRYSISNNIWQRKYVISLLKSNKKVILRTAASIVPVLAGLDAKPLLSADDFKALEFSAYPNPTQDNWTIETSQGTRISSITVFDVLGKSVMSIEPKDDRVVIDGSELRTGLYFAKVETAEGTSSIKLVKK